MTASDQTFPGLSLTEDLGGGKALGGSLNNSSNLFANRTLSSSSSQFSFHPSYPTVPGNNSKPLLDPFESDPRLKTAEETGPINLTNENPFPPPQPQQQSQQQTQNQGQQLTQQQIQQNTFHNVYQNLFYQYRQVQQQLHIASKELEMRRNGNKRLVQENEKLKLQVEEEKKRSQTKQEEWELLLTKYQQKEELIEDLRSRLFAERTKMAQLSMEKDSQQLVLSRVLHDQQKRDMTPVGRGEETRHGRGEVGEGGEKGEETWELGEERGVDKMMDRRRGKAEERREREGERIFDEREYLEEIKLMMDFKMGGVFDDVYCKNFDGLMGYYQNLMLKERGVVLRDGLLEIFYEKGFFDEFTISIRNLTGEILDDMKIHLMINSSKFVEDEIFDASLFDDKKIYPGEEIVRKGRWRSISDFMSSFVLLSVECRPKSFSSLEKSHTVMAKLPLHLFSLFSPVKVASAELTKLTSAVQFSPFEFSQKVKLRTLVSLQEYLTANYNLHQKFYLVQRENSETSNSQRAEFVGAGKIMKRFFNDSYKAGEKKQEKINQSLSNNDHIFCLFSLKEGSDPSIVEISVKSSVYGVAKNILRTLCEFLHDFHLKQERHIPISSPSLSSLSPPKAHSSPLSPNPLTPSALLPATYDLLHPDIMQKRVKKINDPAK